jgi:hypothetical protein
MLEVDMTDAASSLQVAVAGQFHSALTMLGKAIEICPETLWLAGCVISPNRTWHIAYHALFYTHFYLAKIDADFVSWPRHRTDYNFLGENHRNPGVKLQIDQPYTQSELREYLDFCHAEVDRQTVLLDPEAPSGFSWLPFNKLELQFYSLRHLAHHTGQLTERLRSQAGLGVGWAR